MRAELICSTRRREDPRLRWTIRKSGVEDPGDCAEMSENVKKFINFTVDLRTRGHYCVRRNATPLIRSSCQEERPISIRRLLQESAQ